jgi:hypothetical protein
MNPPWLCKALMEAVADPGVLATLRGTFSPGR